MPRLIQSNFFDDAAPFKIDGVYCKLIPLTKGFFAIVDAQDYTSLSKKKWLAWTSTQGRSTYAAHVFTDKDGRYRVVLMHREILELAEGDPLQGDHVEHGETLDNRRKNLRIATHAENQHNRRMYRKNKTGFKGVTWHSRVKQYQARIRINGVGVHLG